MTNHYKTLGAHRLMEPEELRLLYSRLARENHPDRHPNDAQKAQDMAQINVAYGVLGNSKLRLEYHRQIDLLGDKCTACAGKGATAKQKGFTKRTLTTCRYCEGSGVV